MQFGEAPRLLNLTHWPQVQNPCSRTTSSESAQSSERMLKALLVPFFFHVPRSLPPPSLLLLTLVSILSFLRHNAHVCLSGAMWWTVTTFLGRPWVPGTMGTQRTCSKRPTRNMTELLTAFLFYGVILYTCNMKFTHGPSLWLALCVKGKMTLAVTFLRGYWKL